MLMDLDSDEKLLLDGVTDFAERALRPAVRPFVERHEFPTELVRQFAELGFMGTAYDPEYGGGGLGVRGSALVTETLARVEPGFAAIYLCNSAPMTVISRYGSPALKERWLKPLCEGRTLASFGVTEPAGGSDVASIKTRAEEDGDHFVINGAKIFSTNAGTPLHGLSTVIAVTDPEKGPKGLSTFVVPVGTPGFSVGKAAHKVGWRIAQSVELYFDNCRIPKEYMVGNRGDGLKQILTTLSVGRILVGAAGLGLTKKCLDLARSYGNGRRVGGVQIFEHQGLTFPLATVMTKAHAAELMIRNAATLTDAGRSFRTETSMAKLFATELASEAADIALQVHGGYGVFEDYEVSGLLGEAKVLQIVEGTSEVQRLIIARELATS
ncbi:acyl-CoA dehydrogenase family protein [Paraburkholderia sabiae]|uniref:Acyl-CoA dehydrogenase family protein n=1 Tax=Paraburkholderia sabiae TaxID=273251 RepID=A0ABU9QAN9_9BURK|nr:MULTISPECIES: acyl-CoA dehydrogenase family protein [Burkholderiaceae]MDR5877765.1 acyl-CoA dehydrogenase family protein [Caballeronia sp. LZ032]WJZ75473.1 acyl-CoA dehydrogenase family protein [Paraburkholderia sabiae]CAD6535339.1 Acyl-CoA dehydrogenase [Paraburkholderia sabiae]